MWPGGMASVEPKLNVVPAGPQPPRPLSPVPLLPWLLPAALPPPPAPPAPAPAPAAWPGWRPGPPGAEQHGCVTR
jgi:hypothetical protein